jgi:hypothetical protein
VDISEECLGFLGIRTECLGLSGLSVRDRVVIILSKCLGLSGECWDLISVKGVSGHHQYKVLGFKS